MPSGPRHVASRCPGRAPPPAGLRGPSRRLGRLPLALVPAALAFGGLLPEFLEEGAPRVDVDHGDASTLPDLALDRAPGASAVAPGRARLAAGAAAFLLGCHGRGPFPCSSPSLSTVAAPPVGGH